MPLLLFLLQRSSAAGRMLLLGTQVPVKANRKGCSAGVYARKRSHCPTPDPQKALCYNCAELEGAGRFSGQGAWTFQGVLSVWIQGWLGTLGMPEKQIDSGTSRIRWEERGTYCVEESLAVERSKGTGVGGVRADYRPGGNRRHRYPLRVRPSDRLYLQQHYSESLKAARLALPPWEAVFTMRTTVALIPFPYQGGRLADTRCRDAVLQVCWPLPFGRGPSFVAVLY